MPRLIESFDLSGFELIVSSSHCVAKGVRKPIGTVHVSYVHAPMRYIWNRYDDYFAPGRASLPVRLAAAKLRGPLQRWDRASSAPERVDRLVANSQFTADQVEQAYGRRASVVHPFVDLTRFQRPRQAGAAYLMVGAFAPNKRVDIAIQAFNQLKLPLWIVGRGQQEAELRAMAGPTVKFLGALPNRKIEELYAKARAFVFPGVEDFGITPLEAMASGTPIVAYAEGGALETVVDGISGVLFDRQTADALATAVERIETGAVRFHEENVRARARRFTKERFQEAFSEEIRVAWAGAGKDPALLAHTLFNDSNRESAPDSGAPPQTLMSA